MRDFKSDPAPLAKSLLPIRAVAKQKHLVLKTGDSAAFDIYLLNDTGKPVTGKLRFSIASPTGETTRLGSYDVPEYQKDKLSYLVRENVPSVPLTTPGVWKARLRLNAAESSAHECNIWVVDPIPSAMRPLRIGVAGTAARVKAILGNISGITVSPFSPGEKYDVIVASAEPSPAETAIGTDAAGAYKRKALRAIAPEPLQPGVLDALRAGTPVLAYTMTDDAAEGYAQQLSQTGASQYRGMVGLNAPVGWDHGISSGIMLSSAVCR